MDNGSPREVTFESGWDGSEGERTEAQCDGLARWQVGGAVHVVAAPTRFPCRPRAPSPPPRLVCVAGPVPPLVWSPPKGLRGPELHRGRGIWGPAIMVRQALGPKAARVALRVLGVTERARRGDSCVCGTCGAPRRSQHRAELGRGAHRGDPRSGCVDLESSVKLVGLWRPGFVRERKQSREKWRPLSAPFSQGHGNLERGISAGGGPGAGTALEKWEEPSISVSRVQGPQRGTTRTSTCRGVCHEWAVGIKIF